MICFTRLFPSTQDLHAIIQTFDTNGDGCISYNEFLSSLGNVPLTPRVQVLVQKAWDATGRGGCNDCTGHDIKSAFKREEALDCFLNQFSGTQGGNLDGKVTRKEFDLAF